MNQHDAVCIEKNGQSKYRSETDLGRLVWSIYVKFHYNNLEQWLIHIKMYANERS